MSVEVTLRGAGRFPQLRSQTLTGWMEGLLAELAPDCTSLGVRFAGDQTVRRMNRDYRGKDKPTDVLSFPGGDTLEGRHLGDIVISVPTAARQAEARGAALDHEVQLLLLHGVLHCLGYDHETDDGEMERYERQLRRRWLRPR